MCYDAGAMAGTWEAIPRLWLSFIYLDLGMAGMLTILCRTGRLALIILIT